MDPAPDETATPESWFRGDRTNEVELRIVSHLLAKAKPGRILDLGSGNGRLTPLLTRIDPRTTSVDMDPSLLLEARDLSQRGADANFVRGTALQLPFKSGSFSIAVMVRVLHRFPDPARLLGEVRRILRSGGVLLLSHNPRPSLKTLQYDLWHKLTSPGSDPTVTLLPAANGTVAYGGGRGFASPRSLTDRVIEQAGFAHVETMGCGLEDFPILDWLPAQVFLKSAEAFGRLRVFPTWFELLRTD